jgi:hypothetical protein
MLEPPVTCDNAWRNGTPPGRSSHVRPAHNPEVVGSNPTPATSKTAGQRPFLPSGREGLWRCGQRMVNMACRRTGADAGVFPRPPREPGPMSGEGMPCAEAPPACFAEARRGARMRPPGRRGMGAGSRGGARAQEGWARALRGGLNRARMSPSPQDNPAMGGPVRVLPGASRVGAVLVLSRADRRGGVHTPYGSAFLVDQPPASHDGLVVGAAIVGAWCVLDRLPRRSR